MILSRQSWLKNMYAERARLGALGSFLALRGVFSDLVAALRWGRVSRKFMTHRGRGWRQGMGVA